VLIEASLLVGVASTLSYATDVHNLLRARAPAAGAWWYAYEFYFMEGAATALGLLVALCVALRFGAAEIWRRLAVLTLVLYALLLVPLTYMCTRVARVGTDAVGPVGSDRLIGIFGFVPGEFLGKILMAGVYFLKTAGFGFLLGMALVAVVMAALMIAPGRRSSMETVSTDPS
jgi:hypothetical protein